MKNIKPFLVNDLTIILAILFAGMMLMYACGGNTKPSVKLHVDTAMLYEMPASNLA